MKAKRDAPSMVYPEAVWGPEQRQELFQTESTSATVDEGAVANPDTAPFTYRGKSYGSFDGFWHSLMYPEDSHDPRASYPGVQWKFKRSQVEKMTTADAHQAGALAKANMEKMKIDWITFEGRKRDPEEMRTQLRDDAQLHVGR